MFIVLFMYLFIVILDNFVSFFLIEESFAPQESLHKIKKFLEKVETVLYSQTFSVCGI